MKIVTEVTRPVLGNVFTSGLVFCTFTVFG